MIQSMTGYGKAVVTYKEKKINVEIKSLNSKTVDMSTRIAPLYREKELEIRQTIAKALVRGKIDVAVWIEKDSGVDATPINAALVENYYNQIKAISDSTGIPMPQDWFYTLLRMPDVMQKTEVEVLDEEEWNVAKQAIDKALEAIIDYRKQEGKALELKFTEKVDNIEALLNSIEPYEKSRVEKIKARIIDGPNHLKYFRETMAENEANGKKLGFIAQEMGREINTTGSKSNMAEMQNIVVKMKDELEQIKEQVLNAL